jgi:hypothetical protein
MVKPQRDEHMESMGTMKPTGRDHRPNRRLVRTLLRCANAIAVVVEPTRSIVKNNALRATYDTLVA